MLEVSAVWKCMSEIWVIPSNTNPEPKTTHFRRLHNLITTTLAVYIFIIVRPEAAWRHLVVAGAIIAPCMRLVFCVQCISSLLLGCRYQCNRLSGKIRLRNDLLGTLNRTHSMSFSNLTDTVSALLIRPYVSHVMWRFLLVVPWDAVWRQQHAVRPLSRTSLPWTIAIFGRR